jgi:hypothetical protein
VTGCSDWALGFQDETWWSRFALPRLHTWSDIDDSLCLVEQTKQKDDPEPKALACYGILLRWMRADAQLHEEVWLRFVDGRPVSALTIQFLEWCCTKLEAQGKRVLAMVWDNASWHISKAVRGWARGHNRQAKAAGYGVRILACYLPVKSPWPNPDVGDIRIPHLVRPRDLQIADQVPAPSEPVSAVSRLVPSLDNSYQIVVLHHALDAFVIDRTSFSPQLRGDTPIAIGRKANQYPFDPTQHRKVILALGLIVVRARADAQHLTHQPYGELCRQVLDHLPLAHQRDLSQSDAFFGCL